MPDIFQTPPGQKPHLITLLALDVAIELGLTLKSAQVNQIIGYLHGSIGIDCLSFVSYFAIHLKLFALPPLVFAHFFVPPPVRFL